MIRTTLILLLVCGTASARSSDIAGLDYAFNPKHNGLSASIKKTDKNVKRINKQIVKAFSKIGKW